jgi:hypothetical protein
MGRTMSQAEFEARRLKAAAVSAHARVNAVETRIHRLEAAPGAAPPIAMYGARLAP